MSRNIKLETIIALLKEKKTLSIKILDISNISTLADYFVIVVVENQRTVDALDNDIIEYMDKNNFQLRNKEGANTKWVLLDYNDIIIHIFDKEYENFYNLDKLWVDAKEIEI